MDFIKLLMFVLIVFMISDNVSALGIGGQVFVEEDYVPGKTISYSYSIKNLDEGQTVSSNIKTKDHRLADMVVLSHEKLGEGYGTSLTATIKFVEADLNPGVHDLKICVVEDVPEGVGAKARVEVCGTILVKVLKDGLHPVVKVSKGSSLVGKQVLKFSINNLGNLPIKNGKSNIEILNSDGLLLDTIEIDVPNIGIWGKFNDEVDVNIAGYEKGVHTAKSSFLNDDGFFEGSTTVFLVGAKEVRLSRYTKSVEKSGIQPIEVTLTNLWPEEMEVQPTLFIDDLEIETNSKILKKLSDGKFSFFLDTSKLEVGVHEANLKVNFEEDLLMEFPLEFNLAEPKVSEDSQSQINKPYSNSNMVIWVVVAVVLLIVVIIGIFLLNRENDEEDDF